MKRPATIASTWLLALSLVSAPAANAAFPGDVGNIAFSRFTKGQSDIWIVDPATGDTTRVTNTKRSEAMPDWNAAGTRLAYSRCGPGEFSNCEIWTANADGSDPVRLTSTQDVQETWPTWSPDGTKIAYTSNAEDPFQDVWVMDADGTDQTRLTVNTGVFDAFPEWSPDGSTIAFTSDRLAFDDVWVMDADGSDPTRLTTGNKIDERPDWSPDGTRIVFSRNGNVWTMAADGTDLVQVTDNRRFEFAAAYSPDGTTIAFNREAKNGRIGVWTVLVDGSGREQLTNGVLDFFPDWQPV
jgi:TolB protein